MADTIDGLYIEIESGASNAGSQLDALTTKLEGLKRVVGSSTPLKTFSKNYTELMNAINSAPGIEVSKLEGLRALGQVCSGLNDKKLSPSIARNIQTLFNTINETSGLDVSKLEGLRAFTQVMSNMNNIKISGSIAKQLNNLDFVVQNLSSESLTGLMNFINAISQLNQLQNIKISATFVKNLQSLVELAQKIQGQSFSSLNEFTSAIANLSSVANMDSGAVKGLTSSIKSLSDSTKTASARGRTFNTVLANIRVRTLALVRVTQMIRRVTTQAIGVYGDYIETLNLFKMAMGSAGQEAYEFAEKAQALLGIDLTQWMKAQGVFNALATGFGVDSDRAAIMSKNLTQLAYDISSFYNIDVDTAVEKVRSGFSGQIRPVRDLGYDLSQARLEAIALSLGIDKTVKSMTQAEKSQLRYIALMTQLKQVQGDLSRTLDSPINQMRILQAQLQQMYRSIGMTLLPILNKVLPYLNAILRVIKMIADEIAAMFGYTLPRITSGDWTSSVVSGAEDIEDELDSATGAAEKLKNTLAGFDQINLISSKSGGSGSGAGVDTVSGGFDFDLPEYDFLGDAAENKAQQIAEGMMRKLRPFVDFLKDSIKWTVDHIDDIISLLEIMAVVTIGKKLYQSVMNAVGWFNALSDVAKGIGFVTIGLQVSWLGGKDIAQGNILSGIMKSTIGAAATALGMNYLFGPAGAVIGVATSLIMTFEGYRAEKVEQIRKHIQETFYSLEPDGMSLQKISDSWNHFLEQFSNTELLEKDNIATATKETVDTIGQAIVDLQGNYETGVITAQEYGQNLETMYGQMKEAVCKNLEAVNDAINTSLSGPLGLWLEAHGVSLEKLRQSMKFATDEIVEEMNRNEIALAQLNKEYAAGVWSEEQYTEKLNEILGPLKAYYSATGKNVEATDEFLQSFKNIKIDLTDYDSLVDTLEQVQKGYLDTKDEIDKLEKADISNIEALLPFASPEDRAIMEQAIEQTKGYYEAQRQMLNEGYGDLLKSFEEQGAINWSEVYQLNGLEDTHDALYEQFKTIDGIFDDMYGGAGLTRNETYWKTLIEYMDEYEREAANGIGSMEGWNQEYLDMFDMFSYKMTIYSGKSTDALRELERTSPEVYKQLVDDIKKTTDVTGESTGIIERRMSDFDRTTKEIENRERYRMMSIYGYTADAFTGMNNIVGEKMNGMTQTVDAKIRIIGDRIYRTDWCVDPMQQAMFDTANVMSSSSVTNVFDKGAYGLMNEVTGVFGKSRDNIQRAYNMALTPTGNTIVDIGVGIGEKIKEGMLDGAGFVKQGAEGMTKGMAQAFNVFGDKVYDYFMEIGNLGKTVLGGMGLQFGTATFNNTYKKPQIKGYAKGGFPDTADFFYANENGVPEYVGSIGGRTAVATNTDIVKGVSDGVYRAITSTGIQNDVKKIASKNGKVVFAPSEEAGKVMSQSVNMYNGAGGRY